MKPGAIILLLVVFFAGYFAGDKLGVRRDDRVFDCTGPNLAGTVRTTADELAEGGDLVTAWRPDGTEIMIARRLLVSCEAVR